MKLTDRQYALRCATPVPHCPADTPLNNVWRKSKRGMLRGAALFLLGLTVSVIAATDLDKMFALAQQRYGTNGSKTVQQWRNLLNQARGLPESEKIKRVNAFFNSRIAFRDDQEVWGQADYWATPLETMGRGAGDCEDFTIAKYATLKLLDIPIERMRLIYVRAQIGGPHSSISQAHMVLGYFVQPGDEPLILDNLVTDIFPASRRTDLYPVFSFNSEGLWVGNNQSGNPASSATARLSRWRGVLERMRQEGLE